MKASLPALVFALLGAPLLLNAANSLVFFGVTAPDLCPSLRRVAGIDALKIARTGMLFLILQIVIAVAYSSDNFVITQFLGASSVAELAVPAQMFGLITTVLNIALSPLWPAYGEAIARGDHDWVRKTLTHSILVSVALAAVASTALLLAGPWLIGLWVGKTINPPFLLLAGFAVWKVIEIGGNAIAMFLNGANIVQPQIIIATITGVSIVITKLLMVKQFGVSGIPWATIISYLTFTVLPLSIFIPNYLRTRINKVRN